MLSSVLDTFLVREISTFLLSTAIITPISPLKLIEPVYKYFEVNAFQIWEDLPTEKPESFILCHRRGGLACAANTFRFGRKKHVKPSRQHAKSHKMVAFWLQLGVISGLHLENENVWWY